MRARIPQQSLADAYSNEVLKKTIRHKKTDKFLSSEASEIVNKRKSYGSYAIYYASILGRML